MQQNKTNKRTQSQPAALNAKTAMVKTIPRRRRGFRPDQSLGSGSTTYSAPAALSVAIRSNAPRITRRAKSFIVSHRELVLQSIAGSTTFTVQSFLRLNPGLSTVFPWLAPQAIQWDQYAVRSLFAEYVPIAPTSTQGDIILSPNYDASDLKPTTEAQAANNEGAVIAPCWAPSKLRFDVKAMMGLGPRRFVRAASVASDLKTYDVGTLAVCTNNETGTAAIGKLFLDYVFEFFVPQNDPSNSTAPTQTSQFMGSTNQVIATGVATKLNADSAAYDPLGVGPSVGGFFTPPAGSYLVRCTFTALDSASEAFTCSIQIAKNGLFPAVPLSQVMQAEVDSATGINTQFPMNIQGIYNFNGTTDTIAFWCTLTGAAGTLTANSTMVIWQLA